MRYILLIILMYSCSNMEDPKSYKQDYAKGAFLKSYQGGVKINYFEDIRTHLCFAETMPYDMREYSFTCVPCDSVKHLIKEK